MEPNWSMDVVTPEERMGRLVQRSNLLRRLFWTLVGISGFFLALSLVQG